MFCCFGEPSLRYDVSSPSAVDLLQQGYEYSGNTSKTWLHFPLFNRDHPKSCSCFSSLTTRLTRSLEYLLSSYVTKKKKKEEVHSRSLTPNLVTEASNVFYNLVLNSRLVLDRPSLEKAYVASSSTAPASGESSQTTCDTFNAVGDGACPMSPPACGHEDESLISIL